MLHRLGRKVFIKIQPWFVLDEHVSAACLGLHSAPCWGSAVARAPVEASADRASPGRFQPVEPERKWKGIKFERSAEMDHQSKLLIIGKVEPRHNRVIWCFERSLKAASCSVVSAPNCSIGLIPVALTRSDRA